MAQARGIGFGHLKKHACFHPTAYHWVVAKAVVVDTFAEVRESDVMNLAEEMDHVQEMDKKLLWLEIFLETWNI